MRARSWLWTLFLASSLACLFASDFSEWISKIRSSITSGLALSKEKRGVLPVDSHSGFPKDWSPIDPLFGASQSELLGSSGQSAQNSEIRLASEVRFPDLMILRQRAGNLNEYLSAIPIGGYVHLHTLCVHRKHYWYVWQKTGADEWTRGSSTKSFDDSVRDLIRNQWRPRDGGWRESGSNLAWELLRDLIGREYRRVTGAGFGTFVPK